MRTQPRRLGLLGGITWHSSIDYERALNEGVNDALGGSSSADLIVRSYDFQQIQEAQEQGDWAGLASTFAKDARSLQSAGAEAILICANTMHLVAPQVVDAISVPLIHILDVTANALTTAIHELIYEELARGIVRDEGRDLVLGVTGRLVDRGAQGVIAGCTEIPLVLTQNDLDLPYFDTVKLHVAAALDFALSD